MDAYKAITTKRDTRHFDGRALPPATLERILQAGRMAGSSKNTQPVRFVVLQDQERKQEMATAGDFAEHLPSAAAAVAVVLEPGGGAFDAGRAAQNMMVAAWAEGVTSCPTSMHHPDRAREVLGLPPDHTVAIVIALGYPEPGRRLGLGRKRLPLEELVHHERWRES